MSDDDGVARLTAALRERWLVVLASVALTLAAAGAYLLHADRVYRAHAEVLVQPVSAGDGTDRFGLGLLRESGDPARPLETLARLVETPAVADRVRVELGLTQTTEEILRDVEARPVAQSSIVDIAAREPSPAFAQALANAFGRGIVAERTQRLHAELDALIARLSAPVARGGSGAAGASRLAELRSLRAGPDPTVRLVTLARRPISPVSPRPLLTILAALLAGAAIGGALAVALRRLDRRLRRPGQISERGGTVLAELATHPRRATPAQAWGMFEGFRALRLALVTRADPHVGGRIVVITGTGRGVGATTTASGLGWSLAQTGARVVLVEADGAEPRLCGPGPGWPGAVEVLAGAVALADVLVDVGGRQGPRVLPLGATAGLADHPLSDPHAGALLAAIAADADWVVVDVPPLRQVPELVQLTRALAATVVVVARVRLTRLAEWDDLHAVLDRAGVEPAGTVVVSPRPAGAAS